MKRLLRSNACQRQERHVPAPLNTVSSKIGKRPSLPAGPTVSTAGNSAPGLGLGESPSIPTSEIWSPATSVGIASARLATAAAIRKEQVITAHSRATQPAAGRDIIAAAMVRFAEADIR